MGATVLYEDSLPPVAPAIVSMTGDSTVVDTLGTVEAADTLPRVIVFAEEEPHEALWQGMGVSFDLAGLVMLAVADYGSIEGALRINLKGRIFPIVEIGVGRSDHGNENTELHFKTTAPYARVGADYNFARDLQSGNRIFGGVRFGYTRMKFDISGPDLEDYYYGGEMEYVFEDLESNTFWLEIVFGIEAKIWKWFHLGWNARYKRRLSQTVPDVGRPWYVAGFGKNGDSTFGAEFNIVIDI